jgi:hypothetical protein
MQNLSGARGDSAYFVKLWGEQAVIVSGGYENTVPSKENLSF